MRPTILMITAALLVQAQAGSELFSNDMEQRALDKWEKSKSLPRKQKKRMRKDALLDYAFATFAREYSSNLFNS